MRILSKTFCYEPLIAQLLSDFESLGVVMIGRARFTILLKKKFLRSMSEQGFITNGSQNSLKIKEPFEFIA